MLTKPKVDESEASVSKPRPRLMRPSY